MKKAADEKSQLDKGFNAETLYSAGALDLTTEPVVLSMPAVGDRFVVFPVQDAWGNIDNVIGTRTQGNNGGNYLISGPGWKGEVPKGMKHFEVKTNVAFLPGRSMVKSAEDAKDFANNIQDKFTITPLSRWGKGAPNPNRDSEKNPLLPDPDKSFSNIIAKMSVGEYFNKLNELLIKNPPYDYCPCKTIGITGSAGKTTTTTLVGKIAQQAIEAGEAVPYRRVWVGGNIGSPLISMLDQMRADDLAVMELSSFQLELMTQSVDIACILNITPNHLDRHTTMEAYNAAKRRILEFQAYDDAAILGADDEGTWSLLSAVRCRKYIFGRGMPPMGLMGAYISGEWLCLIDGNKIHQIVKKNEIRIKGWHNVENVLAAKLRLAGWVQIKGEARTLKIQSNEEALKEESYLDGCYVIKADLKENEANADLVHDR